MSDFPKCDQLIQLGVERRPANALNIEIGQPLARCKMKLPENWTGHEWATARRWLDSGGSALVFGTCGSGCPRGEEFRKQGGDVAPETTETTPFVDGPTTGQLDKP